MGEREPTKETFGRSELPQELREIFQGFGCGRLAAETEIGVVHICPAAGGDALGRPRWYTGGTVECAKWGGEFRPQRPDMVHLCKRNIATQPDGEWMTSQCDMPQIGPQELDAILRFLPIFERPGYVFGEWQYPPGQFPYCLTSSDVNDFDKALYGQQIVFPFDWPSWQKEAERYHSDPDALETADLLTLRKLLTTHVRKDRFVEGHLASMFECGHITAILRRLKAIREEMD